MDESEYLAALEHGRHMFAWTLVHYGGISAEDADSQAAEFYAYQSPERRDLLLFHNEPWHWAMLGVSSFYWRTLPHFAEPTLEYREEDARFRNSN